MPYDDSNVQGITIHYSNGETTYIGRADIDRMVKARDAIEMLHFALQVAKELNKLNKGVN